MGYIIPTMVNLLAIYGHSSVAGSADFSKCACAKTSKLINSLIFENDSFRY